mmetsp:Transcript_31931/g.109824  ORF Transcript_31931/g.109824 Transcript_31931/m.109824 type:complete len:260 (-) Transcript_31931:2-781(-)
MQFECRGPLRNTPFLFLELEAADGARPVLLEPLVERRLGEDVAAREVDDLCARCEDVLGDGVLAGLGFADGALFERGLCRVGEASPKVVVVQGLELLVRLRPAGPLRLVAEGPRVREERRRRAELPAAAAPVRVVAAPRHLAAAVRHQRLLRRKGHVAERAERLAGGRAPQLPVVVVVVVVFEAVVLGVLRGVASRLGVRRHRLRRAERGAAGAPKGFVALLWQQPAAVLQEDRLRRKRLLAHGAQDRPEHRHRSCGWH